MTALIAHLLLMTGVFVIVVHHPIKSLLVGLALFFIAFFFILFSTQEQFNKARKLLNKIGVKL